MATLGPTKPPLLPHHFFGTDSIKVLLVWVLTAFVLMLGLSHVRDWLALALMKLYQFFIQENAI